MQTQLFGEQLQLTTIFCTQPAATTATLEATQEWNDIVIEIEEKQERILELRKEIGDAEHHIAIVEEEERELEPNEGNEDIFDAEVPTLEEDLTEMRYENESDIRELEKEIRELEGKLKK